jgi:hypothetical protein
MNSCKKQHSGSPQRINISIGSSPTKRCETDLVDPDLGDSSLSALGLEVRLDLVGVITQVDPAIMGDPRGGFMLSHATGNVAKRMVIRQGGLRTRRPCTSCQREETWLPPPRASWFASSTMGRMMSWTVSQSSSI